jgi:hypothetical protein
MSFEPSGEAASSLSRSDSPQDKPAMAGAAIPQPAPLSRKVSGQDTPASIEAMAE